VSNLLELEKSYLRGVPLVTAKGQVDIANCVELHEAIVEEINEGRPRVILDLHALNFIDSACLGMLLRSLDKAAEVGGTLVLVGNPFIDRVLTVTGLTHLFNIFRSPQDAANWLKDSAKQAG